MTDRIDTGEIFRWFSIFKPGGQLTEIRVETRRGTWSGYFKTAQDAINALLSNQELWYGNIWATYNAIDENLSSRYQFGHFEKGATSTSDKDVTTREWVLLDIDSRKSSDTNATDEAVDYATKVVGNKVYQFLINEGFEPPVVVFSANGAHIYLRCQMLNSKENTQLVAKFISAMKMLFDDERVEIDPKMSNASRVAKLPGTTSGKGRSDDKVHPQRMCRFVSIPEKILPNDKAYFEKVAAMLPDDKPDRYNDWGREQFDIQEFFRKHNIEIFKTVKVPEGTRYLLKNCPFDSSHEDGDAMVFQWDNGAMQFSCFHASCAQYHWKDFRLHYEPDAYSRSDYADFRYKRNLAGKLITPFVPQEETQEKGPKWLCTANIKTLDYRSMPKVHTGIAGLDRLIYGGLFLAQVTIFSGRPGSGKSTFLNEVALNAAQQGVPVGMFQGELPPALMKTWIHQTAAGKNHVHRAPGMEDIYYIDEETDSKIGAWLQDKLFLFNRKYGNNWKQLSVDIKELVEEKGVKLVIIDNLMTLSLDPGEGDQYAAQKEFINDLHLFAAQNNIHVILVAHPRKQTTFLRETDIAGTADIGNLADNILIMHRVNQDFENQGKAFFSAAKIADMMKYSNVIEIAKNRIPGTHMGELVGLYYEAETKRMKNDVAEMVQYGWDENPSATYDDDFEHRFYNEPAERYGVNLF